MLKDLLVETPPSEEKYGVILEKLESIASLQRATSATTKKDERTLQDTLMKTYAGLSGTSFPGEKVVFKFIVPDP